MHTSVPWIIIMIAILAIASFIAAIVILILHLLKKEAELNQLEEKEKSNPLQYQEIIKKAHEQADEILDKTGKLSENLFNKTKITNENFNPSSTFPQPPTSHLNAQQLALRTINERTWLHKFTPFGVNIHPSYSSIQENYLSIHSLPHV